MGQGYRAPERVPECQPAAGSAVCPALCRGQPGCHALSADERAWSDQESLSTGTVEGHPQQGMRTDPASKYAGTLQGSRPIPEQSSAAQDEPVLSKPLRKKHPCQQQPSSPPSIAPRSL